METKEEERWSKETIPKVMQIVSTNAKLSQKDLISLLLVTPSLYRYLISSASLWLVLDFREMNKAGDRLLSALSLSRYQNVEYINLEFAQDVEDNHLQLLQTKVQATSSLQCLESLNLNGCQKISDQGIEAITKACPNLKVFSIYWNVRVTDAGIKHLVENCKYIVDLNLSGCKNLSDKSLQLVADSYQSIESLNLTRCVKLTDNGLLQILSKCLAL